MADLNPVPAQQLNNEKQNRYLIKQIVQRTLVGEVEAEQEYVGVLVAQRPHCIVTRCAARVPHGQRESRTVHDRAQLELVEARRHVALQKLWTSMRK